MSQRSVSNLKLQIFNLKFVIVLSLITAKNLQAQSYFFPWQNETATQDQATIKAITLPAGYTRAATSADTFADWLRHLPLKTENNIVYLYDGTPKANQTAQYSILAIDVGEKNLQQCADAVMRLRAEYLFSLGNFETVAFNFTSGHRAAFANWARGFRPRIQGRNVTWRQTAPADSSYKNFREYLDTIFLYAGTFSLSREMKKIENLADIQIGDVFIKSGFPGHAVIVVDLAIDSTASKKAVLLAQSYMPAQEIHILNNPRADNMNPWYVVNGEDKLYTPEWTFAWSELRRF